MKMDYIGIPSLETQEWLLKHRSSSAASDFDEFPASPAEAAVADNSGNEDNDCNVVSAVGSNQNERFDINCQLPSFQDSYRAKIRKVFSTVAKEIEVAAMLVHRVLLQMQVYQRN